jgi:hypothetical protein
MCGAAVVPILTAVLSTGASLYQSSQQSKQAKKASKENKQAMAMAEARRVQEQARLNQERSQAEASANAKKVKEQAAVQQKRLLLRNRSSSSPSVAGGAAQVQGKTLLGQ